ncbi:Cilia- and flagella-associated protein 206 [Hondaea fermentalgiana]|uniref:Cilia- and flagella-associated protein 206 n=1 Tax=Hondaea fermentalgiana TaxID=2315210 RepID=A0A2R5GN87_9STRA|nr:Cilia- and flagella-associated protein 206 [Hondaea fermentalgiana]|eukprot:GBG29334.1 Cilia- and flagella-associated protein 206 [Hondaea fermentalgiana]
MDDVGAIVQEILAVYDARSEGQQGPVSETLAAFMTKTTVMELSDEFRPDKMLNNEDLDKLVQAVVDRLCSDAASAQTIRMQVAFDETFLDTEKEIENDRAETRQRLAGLMGNIASVEEADYDTAKALYRQIFNYLVVAADADSDIKSQAAAHREIAAALESVFPRAGLTTFVTMPLEDKKTHLDELKRIVQGIRLFNQSLGKGGAGIKDLISIARRRLDELIRVLDKQLTSLQAACDKYSAVLVHVHRLQNTGEPLPPSEIVKNWKDEHNNRRQLLAYISCLLDDANHSADVIDNLEDKMQDICAQLQDLVGQKSTLPKTTVYPLFDELGGTVWPDIEHELAVIRSRKTIWDCLQAFYETCPDTIEPSFLRAAAAAQPDATDEVPNFHDGAGGAGDAASNAGLSSPHAPSQGSPRNTSMARAATEKAVLASQIGDGTHIDESKEGGDEVESKSQDTGLLDFGESKAEHHRCKLIPPSAPGFGELVLGLQAFCPYTMAQRNGLLLLGDAQLGVVQYREQYYVFQDKSARDNFMAEPVPVLQGVIEKARASPELIHLLQLEQYFPQVAMGTVLRTSKGAQGPAARKKKVSVGTSTPVHFTEKHIDPNYHWNEWELRRRAIKIVNLRHARTQSVQTVSSHFRRENETQVYPPRETATQTGVQRGTNPPRQHQYVVGLRGLRKSRFARDQYDVDVDSEERREGKDAEVDEKPFVGVVRLTYDL